MYSRRLVFVISHNVQFRLSSVKITWCDNAAKRFYIQYCSSHYFIVMYLSFLRYWRVCFHSVHPIFKIRIQVHKLNTKDKKAVCHPEATWSSWLISCTPPFKMSYFQKFHFVFRPYSIEEKFTFESFNLCLYLSEEEQFLWNCFAWWHRKTLHWLWLQSSK